MTKSRCRIAKTQRDPSIIAAAKYAKAHGLLSKQAKLHSGKYVSRGVLAKVRTLRPQIESGYVGIKVPRKQAEQAKRQGYLVVQGNRIISPSARTPEGRTFQKRIKTGSIGGVKPLTSGHMESIVLPHDIYDLRQLIRDYQNDPESINSLKMPEEMFIFKLYGNESYRPFLNIQTLMQYLLQYKSLFDAAGDIREAIMSDTFENFQIFRMNPYDPVTRIRTRDEREKQSRAKGVRQMPNGNWRKKDDGDLTPRQKELKQRSERLKKRRTRANQTEAQKEADKAKARTRMAAKRARDKQ